MTEDFITDDMIRFELTNIVNSIAGQNTGGNLAAFVLTRLPSGQITTRSASALAAGMIAGGTLAEQAEVALRGFPE